MKGGNSEGNHKISSGHYTGSQILPCNSQFICFSIEKVIHCVFLPMLFRKVINQNEFRIVCQLIDCSLNCNRFNLNKINLIFGSR